MSAVDTYKGQQGMKADTGGYNPDPQLVSWIKQAAGVTGADPVALLATSLMEDGGKLGLHPGDNNTSFGPFQFHVGGALGSHTPAWASTYAAVLNRAQEFKRLGVRGGPGAAAVQRPADRRTYANGVNSLLPIAHSILEKYGMTGGGGGGATPGSAAPSGSPLVGAGLKTTPGYDYYAKSGPQAALDILDADGPAGARMLYEQSKIKYHMPAQTVQTKYTPASLTGAALPQAGGPAAALGSPGGGWGGSYALATSLAKVGEGLGLKPVSEKRSRKMTASGGVSDHWVGSKTSYAYDMSNGSAPTPQMDKFATQAAAALGVPNWHGGVLNVDKGGYRYQILYRTNVGGNHFNHVHVGVRKL